MRSVETVTGSSSSRSLERRRAQGSLPSFTVDDSLSGSLWMFVASFCSYPDKRQSFLLGQRSVITKTSVNDGGSSKSACRRPLEERDMRERVWERSRVTERAAFPTPSPALKPRFCVHFPTALTPLPLKETVCVRLTDRSLPVCVSKRNSSLSNGERFRKRMRNTFIFL